MPKKTKHSRKQKTRRHKNKRSTRKRNQLAGGPKTKKPMSLSGPVDCCICGQTHKRNTMLVPLACLQKNKETAHRICQDCWWSEFAIEGADHKCPGCIKQLPLTPPLQHIKPKPEDIIEISSD